MELLLLLLVLFGVAYLLLGSILKRITEMAVDFSKLQADVDVLTDVVTKVAALVADLKAQIAANDPAAIQATIDALDATVKGADDALGGLVPPAPTP